ncbi:conserved protein of unknown function (plasmid) [Cupriavidus taiwanensis]|uniref:RES domain-containing protein n=1 Tax=Cupriavidus taiwanensis TaxID=164546 RepID=A0A375IK98_9BURK|nr:conserved hypothetical protein [Cupriavidus taiwanensis]SPA36529.1 conserved hypothetical protein [Cupriavidus taiwanensis]SPA53169.1 conserved hypothetical protein [Cupriavidus taiwanensis]SPK74977.1 conserved protein of unknown function [Cupriavidus taiwanensis]
MTAASAPVGRDAIPAGKTSPDTGEAWVRAGTSALLLVPAIVIPEEHNVLINPLHAQARRLADTIVRRWQYDARLA